MVGNTHSSEFPVAFLSLGPGDSELLTIKAVRILRDADVVMVPTSTQSSRAAEIISEWCEAAMKVYDEMFERVATLYHQGLRVVVAVEGDVSIYASVHEVLERLKRAELPVIQLAGIPSFIAAAAKAGLSLCSQQQRLVVLPGDADVEGLKQLLTNHHVVVVMKLSQCQQEVKAFLQQHMDIECHYFENVGTTDEFYTTEHVAILGRTMPYFSLCILYSN